MKKQKRTLRQFIFKMNEMDNNVYFKFGTGKITATQLNRYSMMIYKAFVNRMNKEGL